MDDLRNQNPEACTLPPRAPYVAALLAATAAAGFLVCGSRCVAHDGRHRPRMVARCCPAEPSQDFRLQPIHRFPNWNRPIMSRRFTHPLNKPPFNRRRTIQQLPAQLQLVSETDHALQAARAASPIYCTEACPSPKCPNFAQGVPNDVHGEHHPPHEHPD